MLLKRLENLIKTALKKSNYKLKNYILMESNPDLMDNTKAVFDELICRNINSKYKIVWLVDDKNKFKDMHIKNVKFITRNSQLINRINTMHYRLKAKYIIDCNKCIQKWNDRQFRLYLTHGMLLKVPKEYCDSIGEVDYMLQTSDFFTKINSNIYNMPEEKFISLGLPRNDALKKSSIKAKQFLEPYGDAKKVFWFPTYRNHKAAKEEHKNFDFEYGIPCISNEKQLKELNELLIKNNIFVLLKLHPAEDSTKMNLLDLTNIKIITDEMLTERGITIYELLSESDAMITDYSSIYYDYLLAEKPVALAIPDIELYRDNVGLLFENFEENVVGEYIYKFEDIKKFINNLALGNDIAYEKRMKKLDLYHKYKDADSSRRVVDFFLSKVGEKINEK